MLCRIHWAAIKSDNGINFRCIYIFWLRGAFTANFVIPHQSVLRYNPKYDAFVVTLAILRLINC